MKAPIHIQTWAATQLANALNVFASHFKGDLSAIGGGTLVKPELPLQAFKDAKAALLAAGYTEEGS